MPRGSPPAGDGERSSAEPGTTHGRHARPGEVAAARGASAGTESRHAVRDATAQLLDPVMYRPVRVTPVRTHGRLGVAVQLVVAALLGVMTVVAVDSLRTPRPSDVSARGLLVNQIQDRAASVEELAAANRRVDEEVGKLQTELLRGTDRDLVRRLEESELLAGTVAVAGPGLVVELDDPDSGEGTLPAEARVQDIDIQVVVNNLRAAGAEAIAVNGQRLTALSAIRSAGEAILVDLTPLIGPYRIEAIGDARTMQTQFARSAAAGHLSLLSSTYGISATVRTADRLHLPGATTTTLRYVTVPDDVTSSVRDDDGGTP